MKENLKYNYPINFDWGHIQLINFYNFFIKQCFTGISQKVEDWLPTFFPDNLHHPHPPPQPPSIISQIDVRAHGQILNVMDATAKKRLDIEDFNRIGILAVALEAFKKYDKDKDFKLDEIEFHVALWKVGIPVRQEKTRQEKTESKTEMETETE